MAKRSTPRAPEAPVPAGESPVGKARLEAFSDGVLAIVITIMVLELKVPHGDDLAALRPVVAPLLGYVLSFVYVGIYWNNHHHLLHAVRRVSPAIMWGNLHLLFWLSLVPVATGWLGETRGAEWPTAIYAVILLGAAIAYTILQRAILAHHGPDSAIARAVGRDAKGRLSLALYAASFGLAFVDPRISQALFVAVAAIWLVPDRRVIPAE